MKQTIVAAFAASGLACGCIYSEGTYTPGCIAFEGSNIHLRDGRFTWEKFTDQVIVDMDGNVVNQFPGYPKHGIYRIDRKVVSLETTAGEPLEVMYLHRDGNRYVLLSGKQLQDWQDTGDYADCVLMMEPFPAH
jgi:hypothetical protein